MSSPILRFATRIRRKHDRNGNPRSSVCVYRLNGDYVLELVAVETGVSSLSSTKSVAREVVARHEPDVNLKTLAVVEMPDSADGLAIR